MAILRQRHVLALSTVCAACLVLPVAAQHNGSPVPTRQSNLFTDRHVVSAGIIEQSMDASIRATVPGFDPVGLALGDLGVDDNDMSYYIDYRYRFRPRWSVLAGLYSFSSSGGKIAERDFNFDGAEYTAGASLRADIDVDAYLVDVLYSIHHGEQTELMIGGGLHALDFGTVITGELSLDDQAIRGERSSATLLAPVPNLFASGTWTVNERLAINFVAGWLSANIDEYSGAFRYAHLRAMYRFTESIGVAIGYQRTDIDVTQERRLLDISIDAQLEGPTLTFTYSF